MNTLTATWRVGRRYRVEATIGADDCGRVHLHAQWSPQIPEHLTQREVAAYQRGRDALVSRFAERAGLGSIMIAEA